VPYTVNLVAVPEQAIASIRERGPISGLEERLRLLRESISQDGVQPAGAFMSRHFDEAEEDGDADYEVAVPITAQADGSLPGRVGEARVTVIPAHHAFVTHHSGPMNNCRAPTRRCSRTWTPSVTQRPGPSAGSTCVGRSPPAIRRST